MLRTRYAEKAKAAARFFFTGLMLGFAVDGAADLARSWLAIDVLPALAVGILAVLVTSFVLWLASD